MWEIVFQFGIIDSDVNGGGPIARFRDSMGLMSSNSTTGGAGQGALSSSSVLYDFESDTLHSCAAEKLIK